MKLKKTFLTSVTAIALLSAGVEFTHQNSSNEIVQAAKKTTKKTLKRNAAIYNSKGQRIGKQILKKGKKIKIAGSKTIKGKKYYKIAKNKYVKQANFKASKKVTKKSTKKTTKKKDATIAKYEKLLNAGGALVAIRDARNYDDHQGLHEGFYDYTPYKKGDVIDINRTNIKVRKIAGDYLYQIATSGYGGEPLTLLVSVNDFKYEPYESSQEYKNYLSKVKQYTNNDLDEIRVVTKKGETITIDDPSVVLNTKGEYCIGSGEEEIVRFSDIDSFVSPSTYSEDDEDY